MIKMKTARNNIERINNSKRSRERESNLAD
jgi:hypothetical protein